MKVFRSLIKFFAVVFFTVSGCKKSDSNRADNSIVNKVSSNVSVKVLEYLESQKIKTISGRTSADNKSANIDLLMENLDFASARTEPLGSKLDYLVIPIKDEIINKKSLDKKSTLTLLLTVDKSGKINSGNIVYFQPSDGQKHASIPASTFSNMFDESGNKVALDGMYKMLSLTGRWISQFQIKNGKFFSSGYPEPKDKASKSSQKINARCVDWYLITTIYYTDGTIEQTKEYLNTQCDGDCDNSGVYVSLCHNPESGGGSTTPDTDTEYEEEVYKTARTTWDNVSKFGDWGFINVDVNAGAKFNNRKPEKNRFFDGSLSNFVFYHMSLGTNPTGWASATEIASFAINSNTSVTTQLKGYIKDPNDVKFTFDGNKEWGLNDFSWR